MVMKIICAGGGGGGGGGLRKSHEISLKAHRHACAHGVGTPIARPEKLL